MQFLVLGMLGELGVRTYYESQNKQPYTIRELVNFELDVVDARDKSVPHTLSPSHAAQRAA
jgi:hypothetical protein